MAEDALGIPELREVLHRLYQQSGSPRGELGPDEFTAIANHLYSGTNDGSPLTNPGYWRHLSVARDHRIPEAHLDPFQRDYRKRQWEGFTGPGWSPEETQAIGRDPMSFELSPGDRMSHQWMRDSQYMNDIFSRTRGVPAKPDGSDAGTKELNEALHWYRRGENANFSRTGNPLDTISGMFGGRGNANFKEYGGGGETFRATDNPEYSLGYLNTQLINPFTDAVNRQAMAHPEEQDHEAYQGLRQSTVPWMRVVPAVRDFFANGARPDAKSTVPDALNVARGAEFNRHSPRLPSNMSPEDRVRFIQKMQGAYRQAQNMSGDDYEFARTGQVPSKAGSAWNTITSQLPDLSYPVSGLIGKVLGAIGGKSVRAGAVIASEIGEDAVPSMAATGVGLMGTDGLPPVTAGNFFTPGREARTDLQPEIPESQLKQIPQSEQASALDEAHRGRIAHEDRERTKALGELDKVNKTMPARHGTALPQQKSYNYYHP